MKKQTVFTIVIMGAFLTGCSEVVLNKPPEKLEVPSNFKPKINVNYTYLHQQVYSKAKDFLIQLEEEIQKEKEQYYYSKYGKFF